MMNSNRALHGRKITLLLLTTLLLMLALVWSDSARRRPTQVNAQEILCPPQRISPDELIEMGDNEWRVDDISFFGAGNIFLEVSSGWEIDGEGDLFLQADCLINAIFIKINLIEFSDESVLLLTPLDSAVAAQELAPQAAGRYQLRIVDSDPGFSAAELIILGGNFVIEEILINQLPYQAAVRILMVTQGNRVAEYRVDVVPGVARGHANQFSQWLVTVLGSDRQPLDIYGIWDPRLILLHGPETGGHSQLLLRSEETLAAEDVDPALLFDIVFPFTDNYNGDMPVEVLLYDQELQLIADIDLTDAITEYCQSLAELEEEDPNCSEVDDDLALENPVANDINDAVLPRAPFDTRPTASTNINTLGESEAVADCIPPPAQGLLQATELLEITEECGLLQWEVNNESE